MSSPRSQGLTLAVRLATTGGGRAAIASALAGACCVSCGHAQRAAGAAVARLIPGPLSRRGGLEPARPTGRATQPHDKVMRCGSRAPPGWMAPLVDGSAIPGCHCTHATRNTPVTLSSRSSEKGLEK